MIDRRHIDLALDHASGLRAIIAKDGPSKIVSHARWSRMARKLVSADDVFQEAVLTLAGNLSTYDGKVTVKMLRWAVARGWSKARRMARPIDVSEDRKSDVDRTRVRKAALANDRAWLDANDPDVEELLTGRDPDPAKIAENREAVLRISAGALPGDFERLVRSAVRGVPMAEDARARGVTTQAESAAVRNAALRLAAGYRRAA